MESLLGLLVQIIEIYKWVVIISVVLTWLVQFNVINTSNRIVYTVGDFLYRITEPVLQHIRRIVPGIGGIDLSPIVLLLLLWLAQSLLIEYWPR